jgi:CTP:molybdopterin cytidylyltransferase MocA
MSRARFVGLILGAGRGKRLGKGPKAFVQLDEENLLERAYRLLGEAGVHEVVAVLPPEPDGGSVPTGIIVARNATPETGPLHSAQLGLSKLEDGSSIHGAVLYPVDHFRVQLDDIEVVLAEASSVDSEVSRVVPTLFGTGGHPIVIMQPGIKAILGSEFPEGDTLRDLLSEAGTTRYIEAGSEGILVNLNTPDDLK